MVDALRNDAEYLKDLLEKEDWEIEKSTLDYLLKKESKNRLKSIIKSILEKM